jgi:sugar O-acyltransferase (sialic acid O-acetyltransferase NeuD family)
MLIAGAGNLGLHTLDQLLADQYANEIVFYDEKGSLPEIIKGKYSIISNMLELDKYFQKGNKEFVVTLGQSRIRERLTKQILDAGGTLSTIISKKATSISAFSEIGHGSIIQPGCAISHNVNIANSCLIHASTLIGHDVIIEDYVTIGSMVNILKGVKIGQFSIISPNVLVYQNIKIGRNVYIAPGVMVTKDVKDFETVNL